MATTLFLLSLGFNVRRSREFPVRAPHARVRHGKGGCGGAASMAREVLHGALVLPGPRARRKRAEIAAAAGLRVELARIEAIAARLELADHRRLPRAARARWILRLAARRCVRVAIVNHPSMVSLFCQPWEGRESSAHFACLR